MFRRCPRADPSRVTAPVVAREPTEYSVGEESRNTSPQRPDGLRRRHAPSAHFFPRAMAKRNGRRENPSEGKVRVEFAGLLAASDERFQRPENGLVTFTLLLR